VRGGNVALIVGVLAIIIILLILLLFQLSSRPTVVEKSRRRSNPSRKLPRTSRRINNLTSNKSLLLRSKGPHLEHASTPLGGPIASAHRAA